MSSSGKKLSTSDNILIDGRDTKASIVDIVSALKGNYIDVLDKNFRLLKKSSTSNNFSLTSMFKKKTNETMKFEFFVIYMSNSLRFNLELEKQFVCPDRNFELEFNPKLRLQNMIHQNKLQRLQYFSKQMSEI